MSKIKDGEYILATAFSDGDPLDAWAFGFLKRVSYPDRHGKPKDYYIVVDNYGDKIGPLYRRAQRITREFGDWLILNVKLIDHSGKSLWWWKRHYTEYPNKTEIYKTGGREDD